MGAVPTEPVVALDDAPDCGTEVDADGFWPSVFTCSLLHAAKSDAIAAQRIIFFIDKPDYEWLITKQANMQYGLACPQLFLFVVKHLHTA
jgi:hypothetical protein